MKPARAGRAKAVRAITVSASVDAGLFTVTVSTRRRGFTFADLERRAYAAAMGVERENVADRNNAAFGKAMRKSRKRRPRP